MACNIVLEYSGNAKAPNNSLVICNCLERYFLKETLDQNMNFFIIIFTALKCIEWKAWSSMVLVVTCHFAHHFCGQPRTMLYPYSLCNDCPAGLYRIMCPHSGEKHLQGDYPALLRLRCQHLETTLASNSLCLHKRYTSRLIIAVLG